MELPEFKVAVDDWLDEHAAELAPAFEGIGTLDDQMAQLRKVMRLAYDAGFMCMGWPERVGGLGGSNLLRAYLGEALTARGLVEPGIYSMPEVLAPTMIDFAPEELAAEMVPLLLRGDEIWCQGFSEPGTGSNLASITCRATRTDGGWRVNGQKVWTSLAQYAPRCVLLTRTGTPESAHRGITALFVDMDSPGITVRPIETMHGSPSSARSSSTTWSSRSTGCWARSTAAGRSPWTCSPTSAAPRSGSGPPTCSGGSSNWWRLRPPVRWTRRPSARWPRWCLPSGPGRGRPSAGWRRARPWGRRRPSTKCSWRRQSKPCSISSSRGSGRQVLLGRRPDQRALAAEFLYSRAASIYGGSAEIQRNIIARRLLDLGDER